MNIKDYLKRLNNNSQEIFNKSIHDTENLGRAHHYSSFIGEFSNYVFDKNEERMILTVAIQLESASFNLIYGMYREAFSSLRLAFELGLGAIHFSIHKLEQNEWMKGENDIKWSKLIDNENGVLSKRFCNAFFPEASEYIEDYNDKSRNAYRRMSEFVHGNYETWSKSGLKLKFDPQLKKDYFELNSDISKILIFMLCCRYLKSLTQENKESISEFLLEELRHISPVREYLGGAKEL
ncbi:hypothetical protein NBT05_04405 [Aquimarina sp. ERC-38]|uniref:hypothetical protein n=1 Tax=Aquimarina sp. ERC-38 TaxID=2949996 RepID=UPI002245AB69|nr:hypothetical protein [Aquimarina sp. ERC-38]UZO81714.1 hypothetical protein NBT05_04405 [Aquimarina sp. ERC-38]